MNCIHCHGQVKHSQAPFQINRNGYHLVLYAGQAWVCGQCSEAYFEEREVAAIQSTIKCLTNRLSSLLQTLEIA